MKAFWSICLKCYKERQRSWSGFRSHWIPLGLIFLSPSQNHSVSPSWLYIPWVGGFQQPQADSITTPCVKSSLLQEIPDQQWTNFAYPSQLEEMNWFARQGSHAYPEERCLVYMDSEWEWSRLPWIKAHCGQKENWILDRWQVPPSTASAWSESHTKISFCVWLEHLCSQQQTVLLRKRDLTGFKMFVGKEDTEKEEKWERVIPGSWFY